jgi:PEP-CTERM motif-containing protein/FG-GAP repeat protein
MKSRTLLMALFFMGALSTFAILPARAAVDAFIWFDGVKGEIVEPQGNGHPPIEVASFQFGVGRGISSPIGGSFDRGFVPSAVFNIGDTAQGAFPANSFFDVFFDVTLPGGGSAQPIITGAGAGMAPPASFFDVFLTLDLADGPHYFDMHFQANPNQSGLGGISAAAADLNGDGFPDVLVAVAGMPGGNLNPSQPLFSVTLNSVPEPSTVVLAAFGLVGLAAWGWRRRKPLTSRA